MKVYLARHGEYLMNDIVTGESLSEKGAADIAELAAILKNRKVSVSHIFHSGKKRAQQTAEILATGVVSENPIVVRPGLFPTDSVSAFAADIEHWTEDNLIVGHLPFMSRLVSKLVIANENKDILRFNAGTIVCLEKIDLERWLIEWVLAP